MPLAARKTNTITRAFLKPFRNLHVQLILLSGLAITVVIILYSIYQIHTQTRTAYDALQRQALTLTENIAFASGDYFVSGDYSSIERLLLQSAVVSDALEISVMDQTGTVFSHVKKNPAGKPEALFEELILAVPQGTETTKSRLGDSVIITAPIEQGLLGWVVTDYSLQQLEQIQMGIIYDAVLVDLLAVAISFILLTVVLKRHLLGLERATVFAHSLIASRGEVIPVSKGSIELEQLGHALNYASISLYSATREMADIKFALDAHAIVAMTDARGHISYVNNNFCTISGYSAEDLIGKSFQMLSANHHDKAFYSTLWQTITQGKVWYGEILNKNAQGDTYWVDTTIVPFMSESGEPYQYVSIQTDITERKRSEAMLLEYQEHLEEMVESRTQNLQVANNELESFCYSVSHDLRAPLRSIEGFSNAILEDYSETMPAEARAHLARVIKSSKRMGELINDLLELSSVVRRDMLVKEVDISVMVSGILDDLQAASPDRRVNIKVMPALMIEADSRLLRTMLENILGNAWKFTANTDAALIEFGMHTEGNKHVFYVRDNGAGFDETYAYKLFEPFQRLHTEEEFQGTGVGLATVQRIVRRHNGNVWAEGKPGEGATVYFSFD